MNIWWKPAGKYFFHWKYPSGSLKLTGVENRSIMLKNPYFLNICCMIRTSFLHYSDVIMSPMASQITDLVIVYSTVYTDTVQRKHLSSASLAFVRGNSPLTGEFPAQKGQHRDKCFQLMTSSWFYVISIYANIVLKTNIHMWRNMISPKCMHSMTVF